MLRRTKATLWAAVLALLTLGWTVPDDLPALPDSPIVRVSVPDRGVGSGVVIKQETTADGACKETIVTVAHVVSMNWDENKTTYWPAVQVQSPNAGYAAMVVAYDATGDLALLEKWSERCIAEFALPVATGYVVHGTPVWTGGWLYGEELTIISGVVGHYWGLGWYEEMKGPYMTLSAMGKPGMSGGAVMKGGELHAIVSGRSPEAELYTIAVPAWRIQQFLDTYAEIKDL